MCSGVGVDDGQRRLDALADRELQAGRVHGATKRCQRRDRVDRLRGRPHVADPRQLAQGFATARWKHHAVAGTRSLAKRFLVDTLGRPHSGRGRRRDLVVGGPDRQAHRGDPRTHGLCRQRVARPNGFRPLIEIEIERRVEPVDLRDRWRERERLLAGPGIFPVDDA